MNFLFKRLLKSWTELVGSAQTGFCGILGEQVDAINYYTSRIEKLTEEVSPSFHLYGRDIGENFASFQRGLSTNALSFA